MLCPEVREECSIAAMPANTVGSVHCVGVVWGVEGGADRLWHRLAWPRQRLCCCRSRRCWRCRRSCCACSSSGKLWLALTPAPPSLSSLSPPTPPCPLHQQTA
eukprot:2560557-Rhodomonas_salina.1